MTQLESGMLLYHASYTEIREIDLTKCKSGLDFGNGFYLTANYQQAVNYVPLGVKKAVRTRRVSSNFSVSDGVVNVYRIKSLIDLSMYHFEGATAEWLHLVAANRDSSLFPEILKQFRSTDIIAGKIADDDTARTLAAYIGTAYGIPGTSRADDFALSLLLPDRLAEQICFRTERAVQQLEFVRSERYGDIKHSSQG